MAGTTNISMSCIVGEEYQFYCPVTLDNNFGIFPRKGKLPPEATGKEEEVELQGGFYIENDEVGEITLVHTDKVAINYLHKKPGDQVIWLLALTGEKIRISIATMPIHDHATVNTGGPAYGTYYSPPLPAPAEPAEEEE